MILNICMNASEYSTLFRKHIRRLDPISYTVHVYGEYLKYNSCNLIKAMRKYFLRDERVDIHC